MGISDLNYGADLRQEVSTDTSREIFSNSSGVMIYFPYSDNFFTPLTVTYFDEINTYPGYKATIVAADREADFGPGQEPYVCGTIQDRHFCFRPVTVDDAYAEIHPSRIVGVHAERSNVPTEPPPSPVPGISRVFHGWSRLTKQLDKFISFTGNGGGSEMKVSRISGYLQFQNQQVTNFAGDIMSIDYKRKEIRKKRWKRVYGVWDADWVVSNLEQTYAAWEDDTQGTKTFTGSLGTTVTFSQGNTGTGTIGYSISVMTQDELVTQRKITRTAYFGAAKADQGCGFQMSDDLGSRYDNTFLTSGNWPIYDCGTIWGYTWSYNIY